MGLVELIRSIVGDGTREEEIVGTIVEGPSVEKNGNASDGVLVFRLDSRPDLEFRQEIRPLAPTRQRGDRVKVHCTVTGDDKAIVAWIEKG